MKQTRFASRLRALIFSVSLVLAFALSVSLFSEGASSLTAPELVAKMKLGWNLGNSLDAAGSETAWGNPAVTEDQIKLVADSGFGAIRIPVTWVGHFGPGPEYKIEKAWMDRVKQVVGWSLEAGLIPIINMHHDGAEKGKGEWLALDDSSGKVTTANNTAVMAQFKALWTQIAASFADVDERVVLEGMNEIHVGYGPPKFEYYTIVNKLNQAFVDTVRSSGGKNANRCLLVPGYNTNIQYTLQGFDLPKDSAKSRLILSVHCYDPWDYAGAGKTHVWGAGQRGADGWGQEGHFLDQFDKLESEYVKEGVPVIIGEYGAVNQKGYEKSRRYYMEFVTKAAHDRGIVPFFWDNGSRGSGPEAFGLLDRRARKVMYPDILAAMMRAVTKEYTIDDIELP